MATSIRDIKNDTELDVLLNKTFLGPMRCGYVEVGDDKYCLPIYYRDYFDQIRNFQVRDDDVYIAAHPKTGTTWLQEMVWLIVNDLNYDVANSVVQLERFPQLEFGSLFNFSVYDFTDISICDTVNYIPKLKSPRCIKTHLPWSLLPQDIQIGTKKPKIIAILRGAEDVCVSLYHHSKVLEGYQGTFEEFCKLFLGGRVCFGPFWKQVLSYWEQREKDNILFLKYKDMKDDLSSVIRIVANFLGKNLDERQIQALSKHLSFESMKNNRACNNSVFFDDMVKLGLIRDEASRFIRKGNVGGFKSVMSPELVYQFKSWTDENTKNMGLSLE